MIARDLKLDASGDFELENGDLALVSDVAAIGQAVRIRLQFFKGEWFLDEDAGVPYYQDVLGKKNPSPNVLAAIFQDAVLETPGVASISDLRVTIDAQTRRLSVTVSALSDTGELVAVEV